MNMKPVEFSVSYDNLHKVVEIVSRIALLVRDVVGKGLIARVTYRHEMGIKKPKSATLAASGLTLRPMRGARTPQYAIEVYIQLEKDCHTQVRHYGNDVSPTVVWGSVISDLEHAGLPFLIELSTPSGQKLYIRWQKR